MKFFAISCILFVALAAPFADAENKGLNIIQKAVTALWRGQCRSSLGASMANEDLIRSGKFDQLQHIDQCLILCVNQKAGFFDSNGVVNGPVVQEQLAKLIGAEKATIVNTQCNGLIGTDACDSAAKIYACHHSYQATFLFN